MAIIGNALKVLSLKATVHVTTKAGTTLTFKKNGVVMGTRTADSSGTGGTGFADFDVLSGDWGGSWTVEGSWSQSGISTPATGTASFAVSAATTYNVTVTLVWYLIQGGDFKAGFSHKVVGESASVFQKDPATGTDRIWLTVDKNGNIQNYAYASGYFTNGINMDYWKTLNIRSNEKGQTNRMGLTNSTTAAEASFTHSMALASTGKNDFSANPSNKSLNISAATGTKYVALRTQSWIHPETADGAVGTIRVYNLYLQG